MVFCLSNNLNFYFRQREIQIEEWQLFLLMDPIGFNYFGINGDNYELLNGINNTTDGFLNKAIGPLGFQKKIVETGLNSQEVWDKNMLLEVDDYYLEYNPFYDKYHNTRFVVATKMTDDHYEVYDTERKKVGKESLENSVISVFELEKRDEIEKEAITAFLIKYFRKITPFLKEEAIGNIKRLGQELDGSPELLTKESYKSLFFFVNRPVGPAVIRQITSDSLLKLSGANGSEDCLILVEKAKKLKKLSELWSIIGNLFFKLSRNESPRTLDSICNRLQEVIELESRI